MDRLENVKLEFDASAFCSPDFSFQAAYYLGHVSLQTYEKEAEMIKKRFSELGDDSLTVTPFKSGNTEGILIDLPDDLIISYRGTESRADWAFNFKAKQINSWFKFPGRIHQGFFEALNQVWTSHIEGAIKGAHEQGKKVILTGHSLGGALSLLTAARIARLYQPRMVKAIYTFGQPKVGDPRFAEFISEHFPDTYYRFVNHRDIVPCIPPSRLGYDHCGKLYHFDDDGDLKAAMQFESIEVDADIEVDDYERFKIEMLTDPSGHVAKVTPDYESLPPPSQLLGIDDHSMIDEYLPALRKQLDTNSSEDFT